MSKLLLLESRLDQTRAAILEEGELCELYMERRGREKLVGNVYKGRVANILPGMQAAFVDIGLDKNAFLYAGDIMVDKSDLGEDPGSVEQRLISLSIKKMLKVGQQVIVQVIKEPGGQKGPRITTHVTLPGRMSVLLPTVDYVGVSRRIDNEPERARLRELAEGIRPEGMGMIVRTVAQGAQAEHFAGDLAWLTQLWRRIQERAQTAQAPTLLHREESLSYRAVRDMLTDEVDTMYVSGEGQFARAMGIAQSLSPALAERIQEHTGAGSLFDAHRVDARADKAIKRRVWLKSGGFLVFDHSEAMTSIDVNTGKYVGSRDLAETVFQLNCEAAVEIAHQLRLRDVGGIIVIDFIDMEGAEHREQLVTRLRNELKRDHTKTNVLGLTGLGLVEMTRKKVHQPLYAALTRNCPYCGGEGRVRAEDATARMALDEIERRAAQESPGPWLVRAHSGVTECMLHLWASSRTLVLADDAMHIEKFDISPLPDPPPAGAKTLKIARP